MVEHTSEGRHARTTSTVRTQGRRNSNGLSRVQINSNILSLFRTEPTKSQSRIGHLAQEGTENFEQPSRNSNSRAEIRTATRSPSRSVTAGQSRRVSPSPVAGSARLGSDGCSTSRNLPITNFQGRLGVERPFETW